jgi:hypothetical protein
MKSPHLRRALLLFAIVLGLAALVASVSQPRQGEESSPGTRTGPPARGPTATPRPDAPSMARITFGAEEPRVQRLAPGRPAVVLVKAPAAGQVEIPRLGLAASADPLTPARFDVLAREQGRYDIRFIAARGGRTIPAGTLVVRREAARPQRSSNSRSGSGPAPLRRRR